MKEKEKNTNIHQFFFFFFFEKANIHQLNCSDISKTQTFIDKFPMIEQKEDEDIAISYLGDTGQN